MSIRSGTVSTCILGLALLTGCGDGDAPPQDLGGSLSLTADGKILGALPLESALPSLVED